MFYTLPINSFYIKDVRCDDIIDMSDLKFDDSIEDKQRAALLFIRNTAICPEFKFDKCTFEEKEHYLILYLTAKRMDVYIPILISTWVKILTYGKFNSNVQSILSDADIDTFRSNNKELIDEIYRFLISIPLCAMVIYKDRDIDISCYEKSDYSGFNPYTFVQLFSYNEIVILAQGISGFEPVYYMNYFRGNNMYPYFVSELLRCFPYLALLNIIDKDDPELTSRFISGLQGLLGIGEE